VRFGALTVDQIGCRRFGSILTPNERLKNAVCLRGELVFHCRSATYAATRAWAQAARTDLLAARTPVAQLRHHLLVAGRRRKCGQCQPTRARAAFTTPPLTPVDERQFRLATRIDVRRRLRGSSRRQRMGLFWLCVDHHLCQSQDLMSADTGPLETLGTST
jgi:hypothetical protein